MRLRRAGESKVIEILRKRHRRAAPNVRIGIGDDTALIRRTSGRDMLLTTDLLVEGVDFDLAWTTFREIGYKAMAANLSDIASMGGVPLYALASIALPGKTSMASVRQLYRGLTDLARRYGVHLIGGDTSSTPGEVMVSVTLIGEVEPRRAIRRSGARPGDRIFVTGTLGDARAGLERLEHPRRGGRNGGGDRALVRRFLHPSPRVREGRILAERGLATAMIDLSDGLSTDLHHLCDASGVGATLDPDRLPVSPSLRKFARRRHADPVRYALSGGEDFELLFTVKSSKVPELLRLGASGKLNSTMIGEIEPRRSGVTTRGARRRRTKLAPGGYEHFTSRR